MLHNISYRIWTQFCFAFLCCVISSVPSGPNDLIYPYLSNLLHWHWDNNIIAPVPMKWPPKDIGKFSQLQNLTTTEQNKAYIICLFYMYCGMWVKRLWCTCERILEARSNIWSSLYQRNNQSDFTHIFWGCFTGTGITWLSKFQLSNPERYG